MTLKSNCNDLFIAVPNRYRRGIISYVNLSYSHSHSESKNIMYTTLTNSQDEDHHDDDDRDDIKYKILF